jgi:ceramide glucosyltransferase
LFWTIRDLLVEVLTFLSFVGAAYQILAAHLVRRFASGILPGPPESPAVTILKPVCGADAGLYANLRTFCLQDYAGPLQIVIGAHTEDDAAVPIVRRLIADLPERDIALVIDPRLPGSNFKVCNVLNMMPTAKHDILLLADSDMRVEPHYVATLVSELLRPGVGLVTCLYKATPWPEGTLGQRLASRLGSGFINFGFLPSVLVGRMVGADTGSFGASLAIARTTLARVGGFEALRDQLADDYVLGHRVREAGLEVAISSYLIENVVFEPSLSALIRHELRWQRTIRSISPAGHAGSVITNPVAIALIALIFSGFSGLAWAAFAVSLAGRSWLIYSCNAALRLKSPSFALIPLRDALTLALLIASFCGQRVTWRDRAFHLEADGALTVEGDRVV